MFSSISELDDILPNPNPSRRDPQSQSLSRSYGSQVFKRITAFRTHEHMYEINEKVEMKIL